MFLKTITTAVCLTTLTTGCAFFVQPTHNVTVESPTYDPATSARVRVLSGNGTGSAVFRTGEACYKTGLATDDATVKVGDGFWSTLKYSSRSITIGMPTSPRKDMTVAGLDFKDFIREYVVPASKPLTVTLAVGGDWGHYHWSCSPSAAYFTPQPGQDYDIFLDQSAGRCWVAVRRIDGHELDESVALKIAPKCPS